MKTDFFYFTHLFNYFVFQLQRTINSIGLNYKDRQVNIQIEVFISILNRIGINISSINHLSKTLHEEQISSSIALLFRACLSDIILGHYLLSFKSDIITFENEIRVLNQSFLKKYVNDIYKVEQELLSTNEEDFKNRVAEFNNILKEEFLDILVDDNLLKTKSAKKIRDEFRSNKKYFNDMDVYNSELSESTMFKHLFAKKNDLENYYKQVKVLWKYFSQFQHYTFPGRHFINDKKENFLLYFFQSLIDCYNFTNILKELVFQIDIPEFELNKQHLSDVYKEYSKFLSSKKAQS